MTTIDFFNVKITLLKSICGLICMGFGVWIGMGGYLNPQFDPLIKVILYTFALGVTIAGFYLANYVDYRYLDSQKQQLQRVSGFWFFPRYSVYPYQNMKAVEVRMHSTTNERDLSVKHKTVDTRYSAVIKLADDELYFLSSSDKQQTIHHAQQLADSIGIPLRVKTHGRVPNQAKDAEISFARMAVLLALMFAMMGLIYGGVVLTT